MYVCRFCHFTGSCNDIIENHVRSTHIKQELDPDEIAAEIQRKQPKKYFCDSCDYSTIRNHSLQRHKKTLHVRDERLECDKCEYVAFLKDNLIRHVKIHDKLPDNKCTECDFASFHQIDLAKHKKFIHEQVKHFKCSSCSYMSQSNCGLKRHFESNHEKEKHLQCSYDGCKYKVPKSDSQRLKRHIASQHETDKLLACEECDYKTSVIQNLRNHNKQKHMDPEDFVLQIKTQNTSDIGSNLCPECGKYFTERSNMKTHYKVVHSGIKEFSCENVLILVARKEILGDI